MIKNASKVIARFRENVALAVTRKNFAVHAYNKVRYNNNHGRDLDGQLVFRRDLHFET